MFNFISIYIYIDAVALAALVTLATYLCSKNADWWWQQHVRVTGCSTYIQTVLTERVGWLTTTTAPAVAVVKQVEERRTRIAMKEVPPRESGGFTRSPSPFYAEQQKIMQQQQHQNHQQQQQQHQNHQQQQHVQVQLPPERPNTPRDTFKSLFAQPQTPERPMTPRPMTPRPSTPGGRNVLSMVKRLEDK